MHAHRGHVERRIGNSQQRVQLEEDERVLQPGLVELIGARGRSKREEGKLKIEGRMIVGRGPVQARIGGYKSHRSKGREKGDAQRGYRVQRAFVVSCN